MYDNRSLPEIDRALKDEFTKETGRKLHPRTKMIREAVVLIKEETTLEDLEHLCSQIQNEYGYQPLRISVHRDEGHWENEKWISNCHAHLVFGILEKRNLWDAKKKRPLKGRTIKLNRADMRELQTLTAKTLNMERGKPSGLKHLAPAQYIAKAMARKVAELENDIAELNAKKKMGMVSRLTTGEIEKIALLGAKASALTKIINGLKGELPSMPQDLQDKMRKLFLPLGDEGVLQRSADLYLGKPNFAMTSESPISRQENESDNDFMGRCLDTAKDISPSEVNPVIKR